MRLGQEMRVQQLLPMYHREIWLGL